MDGLKPKATESYIMVAPDDVPSISQLEEAISRLSKDVGIIGKCRGRNDEDPEALSFVVSFLETFVRKYKKQLRKQ